MRLFQTHTLSFSCATKMPWLQVFNLSSWLILIVASGCSEFLSESPDNRTSIDSPKKVAQLLVNAYSGAQHALFTETMSDNVGDKGTVVSRDDEIVRSAYRWAAIARVSQDSPAYYWQKGYEAIGQANQALEAIQRLGGGAVLDPMKGEALLTRAYAHLMLLNIFSQHYDPKTADTEQGGIPYLTATEKNALRRYKRATIQQVYDAIERDMNEGLPLVKEDYKKPKFHFTPVAAHAFAARFYLWKGGNDKAHWQKVVDHANKVLGSGTPPPSLIRDQNSALHRRLSYTERRIRHTSSRISANLLITWSGSGISFSFLSNRYGLSNLKKAELFGDIPNPVGNPFNKNWGYEFFNSGLNRHNYYARFYEYFQKTNLTSGTGNPYSAIIHLTADEALLTRAEAYAMLNEFEKASADLTVFLSRKTNLDSRDNKTVFAPTTDKITLALMRAKYPRIANEYTPYYTLTDDQAVFVKGISELRRREFLHEGMRWFDIKRFKLMVEHQIVGEKALRLKKNDPRRAVQIPQYVQVWGIKPNPR